MSARARSRTQLIRTNLFLFSTSSREYSNQIAQKSVSKCKFQLITSNSVALLYFDSLDGLCFPQIGRGPDGQCFGYLRRWSRLAHPWWTGDGSPGSFANLHNASFFGGNRWDLNCFRCSMYARLFLFLFRFFLFLAKCLGLKFKSLGLKALSLTFKNARNSCHLLKTPSY